MAFNFPPERGINIVCLLITVAAPVLSIGPITGGAIGAVSAFGLLAAMKYQADPNAGVRRIAYGAVWAIRIFVVAVEQMAYQDVYTARPSLPFGWSAETWGWITPVFMAALDLFAYAITSARAAANAEEQAEAAYLSRADTLEKERAERLLAEQREKREHEARLAQIAADTAKAQAEAAARAQAEAARAQAEAQAEAARAQAEAVRIKAEADRKAAEVAAEAARKQAEERRKQAEATAEADRKREEDERKRQEAARKLAEAAAEAKRLQAEAAEARRNEQLIEQQRIAQQRAEQQQREREAAEAANRKREQEEAEARAASDAKRNRFRLASGFERLQMIAETEATLTSALNRRPTQAEIANELGTTDRTLRECLKLNRAAQAA